jgi:hypothetical protein
MVSGRDAMNVGEAAAAVGRSERTISAWIKVGVLPAIWNGRERYIDPDDLAKVPHVLGMSLAALEESSSLTLQQLGRDVKRLLRQMKELSDLVEAHLYLESLVTLATFAKSHRIQLSVLEDAITDGVFECVQQLGPGENEPTWFIHPRDHVAVVERLRAAGIIVQDCGYCRDRKRSTV